MNIRSMKYELRPELIATILGGPLNERIGFAFESIDPRTRAPRFSHIGFDCDTAEIAAGATGDAAFAKLWAARKDDAHPLGGCVGLFGYHASPAGLGPTHGSATTPARLILQPKLLLAIDHVAGVGTAIAYDGTIDLAGEVAAILAQTAPPLSTETRAADLRWVENLSEAEFTLLGQQIIDAVAHDRDLAGAVLSVRQSAELAIDPAIGYRVLRSINLSTYMFMARGKGLAAWGATSLTLLRGDGGHILAETDGGTHRVVPGAPAWVPTPKEMSEYDAVVEALKDDLSPLIDQSSLRFMAEREVRQFFRLEHIFAEVEADLLPSVQPIEAIARLSPHGATIGYRRDVAAALIDQIKVTPRGPYAGSQR